MLFHNIKLQFCNALNFWPSQNFLNLLIMPCYVITQTAWCNFVESTRRHTCGIYVFASGSFNFFSHSINIISVEETWILHDFLHMISTVFWQYFLLHDIQFIFISLKFHNFLSKKSTTFLHFFWSVISALLYTY